MEDNTICIKNCPITWTVGIVRGMFSKYGTIEEVQLTLDPSSSTQCVIIEFESAEDAEAVLEELKDSVYDASIYHPPDHPRALPATTSTSTTAVESTEGNGCGGVRRIHCSNSNCTNQLVLDTSAPCSSDVFGNRDSNVYCSDQCYTQNCVAKGKVDIYDKWIASLGRSGTGLLKDRRKALDKFIITVDMDGERSVRLEK